MDTRAVYCHFSFKRPKGKDYGLFAVAFYWDEPGKRLAAKITRRLPLWQNHQFITAIQSYENALHTIYNWQGIMKSRGITDVLLVTDNSTLAGWIENPKKNKAYTGWMNKAVQQYRAGAPREITLAIGLCDVRQYEKSYKYCTEEQADLNTESTDAVVKSADGRRIINLDASNIEYTTIDELEASNINKPVITGI